MSKIIISVSELRALRDHAVTNEDPELRECCDVLVEVWGSKGVRSDDSHNCPSLGYVVRTMALMQAASVATAHESHRKLGLAPNQYGPFLEGQVPAYARWPQQRLSHRTDGTVDWNATEHHHSLTGCYGRFHD